MATNLETAVGGGVSTQVLQTLSCLCLPAALFTVCWLHLVPVPHSERQVTLFCLDTLCFFPRCLMDVEGRRAEEHMDGAPGWPEALKPMPAQDTGSFYHSRPMFCRFHPRPASGSCPRTSASSRTMEPFSSHHFRVRVLSAFIVL